MKNEEIMDFMKNDTLSAALGSQARGIYALDYINHENFIFVLGQIESIKTALISTLLVAINTEEKSEIDDITSKLKEIVNQFVEISENVFKKSVEHKKRRLTNGLMRI